MTKTINCAECHVEYTYEPPKGHPDQRKYCANCSEKKKASWEDRGEVPVERPMERAKELAQEALKEYDKPKPTNGFKLTDENIRIGALTCAIEFGSRHREYVKEDFWERIKEFEDYIRNGK